MNTYKIKAFGAYNKNLKLVFTVEARTLLDAQNEARKKLKREGHSLALIDTITELGPSKVLSPAKSADIPAELGGRLSPTDAPPRPWVKCSAVGCNTRIPEFGFCPNCKRIGEASATKCPDHDAPLDKLGCCTKFDQGDWKDNTCSECGLIYPFHAANCGSMSMDAPRKETGRPGGPFPEGFSVPSPDGKFADHSAPREKTMCKNRECFNVSDMGEGTYCWECSL